jgi:hypothetical protein
VALWVVGLAMPWSILPSAQGLCWQALKCHTSGLWLPSDWTRPALPCPAPRPPPCAAERCAQHDEFSS